MTSQPTLSLDCWAIGTESLVHAETSASTAKITQRIHPLQPRSGTVSPGAVALPAQRMMVTLMAVWWVQTVTTWSPGLSVASA
jgi:hypothetical protein